jgi:hypothetical protein
MKIFIALISLCFLFLLLVPACTTETEDNITALPVVKKTTVNYDSTTISNALPDLNSLNSISNAYSNNYTEEIKTKLLSYMRGEVSKLGEDLNIFDNVLSLTGCKIGNEFVLPTYAEKAKYENQEVWLFQLTYGLGNSNFGRSKCFVFNCNNFDTLWAVFSR